MKLYQIVVGSNLFQNKHLIEGHSVNAHGLNIIINFSTFSSPSPITHHCFSLLLYHLPSGIPLEILSHLLGTYALTYPTICHATLALNDTRLNSCSAYSDPLEIGTSHGLLSRQPL